MPSERSSKAEGKRRQRSTSPLPDKYGASSTASNTAKNTFTMKREDQLFFDEEEEVDELEDEEGALPDDRIPTLPSANAPRPIIKMEANDDEEEEEGALPDDRSHVMTRNTTAKARTVKDEYIVISDDEDEGEEEAVLSNDPLPAVAAVTAETEASVTTMAMQDHMEMQQIVEIDSIGSGEACPIVIAADGHASPQEQPEGARATDHLAESGTTAQDQVVPSDAMDIEPSPREEDATIPSIEITRPDTTTNRIIVRIPEALQARAARRAARSNRAPSAVRVSIRNEYEDAIRANLKTQAELWLYGQMTDARLRHLRHECSQLQNQYEQHRVAQYMHEYYLRHPSDVHPTTARAIREAYQHHRRVLATPQPSTPYRRTHYAVLRSHDHVTGTTTTTTCIHPFLPPA